MVIENLNSGEFISKTGNIKYEILFYQFISVYLQILVYLLIIFVHFFCIISFVISCKTEEYIQKNYNDCDKVSKQQIIK